MKPQTSEIQLQAQCFQYMWNTHPATRRMFFHVPNGGSRNAIEGMQLKASGVVAGIPDCLWLTGGTIVAFEFKTATGTVSPQQAEVHAAWTAAGYTVYVIRTFQEFTDAVNNHLVY